MNHHSCVIFSFVALVFICKIGDALTGDALTETYGDPIDPDLRIVSTCAWEDAMHPNPDSPFAPMVIKDEDPEIAKRHIHFRCSTEGSRHPDLEGLPLTDEDSSKAAAMEGPNSDVALTAIEGQNNKPNPVGSTAGRILCDVSMFFLILFLGNLQMFP